MPFNLSTLLDKWWPERCAVCRNWGALLCFKCLAKLPAAPAILNLPRAYAAFNYENKAVRQIIWQLKYRGRRRLAQPLAEALAEVLLEPLAELDALYPAETPWLLVPVPLAPRKKRARGFNQTEELARALANLYPAIFELAPRALTKIRETASQTTMPSRAARAKNVKGAFAAPQALAGRHALLLDDVITTGATVLEAARTLRAAGARLIVTAALAHGE